MSTEDVTHVRIAKNQATFRAANDQVEAAAEAVGIGRDVPFICECAEPACTQIVPLDLAEYAEIRRHPRRFFNVPGHEETSVRNGAGIVLERRDGLVIVDKVGVAGEVAAAEYGESPEDAHHG